MSSPPEKKGRPMAYPYTHTAKFVQFPWKTYFEKGWVLKYYLIAVVCCLPFHHKISKLTMAPENRLKWKKIREDWYGPHSHH